MRNREGFRRESRPDTFETLPDLLGAQSDRRDALLPLRSRVRRRDRLIAFDQEDGSTRSIGFTGSIYINYVFRFGRFILPRRFDFLHAGRVMLFAGRRGPSGDHRRPGTFTNSYRHQSAQITQRTPRPFRSSGHFFRVCFSDRRSLIARCGGGIHTFISFMYFAMINELRAADRPDGR